MKCDVGNVGPVDAQKIRQPTSIIPPHWVDQQTWIEFQDVQAHVRKKKRAPPLSQSIADRIFGVIEALRAKGHDGNELLHKMIDRGWLSIEEDWIKPLPKAVFLKPNDERNIEDFLKHGGEV